MKKALKVKWIKALRSGRYRQAKGRLKSLGGGYCCLGVLCNVMGAKWKTAPEDHRALMPVLDGKRVSPEAEFLLTKSFLKKVGLTRANQSVLADMNDGDPWANQKRQSFKKIADHIEANL